MSLKIHKIYSVDETIFNPDKLYVKGDGCIYLGKTYICVAPSSLSQIPLVSSDWDNERSGSIRKYITLETTSTSSSWDPSITFDGSELEWSFSGDISLPTVKTSSGSQTFNLSSNTGTAVIQLKNVESVRGMQFYNLGLTSINVTQCTALENLALWSNNLTELDITNNPKLETLFIDDSKLTVLNTSKNPELTRITADENNIESFDFSNNPKLEYLYLSHNNIESLDISNLNLLETIFCSDTPMVSITLGSIYTELTRVHIPNNKLTELDLTTIPTVTKLDCRGNELVSVDARGVNASIDLDTYDNPNLLCIQVDNPAAIPASWQKDAGATYSTTCPL